MYYRVTKINVNQGHMNDVVNCLDSISDTLYEVEGLHSINCIKVSETEAYAFSCYDNVEQVKNATPFQQEVFGEMKKYFSAPPEVIEGPQLWNWSPKEVTV